MILQALTKLYQDLVEQKKIACLGWGPVKVSYALCINEEGDFEQIIPLIEKVRSGKKTKLQPQIMELPAAVKKSSGIASNFLWENSSYLLGVDKKGKPERSLRCFEECRELHHKLLDRVDSLNAKAILKFFDAWNPEKVNVNPSLFNRDDVISGKNIVFRINGSYAQSDNEIRSAWQRHYDCNDNGRRQQCLVTGKADVIELIHPSIKGVDGAQTSGAAIVSFNARAFCSYGHVDEQGYNAPVGKFAAFAYTSALNYLLDDRNGKQKLGDATVVFWADGGEPAYQGMMGGMVFGDETPYSVNELRSMTMKLLSGERVQFEETLIDPQKPFYILGLSPNAARLSVRFFYSGTFGSLMRNVHAHHNRMDIVHSGSNKYGSIPLWAMLRETVNTSIRNKSKLPLPNPVMSGAVARAIFTGGLYPPSLLSSTMVRINAERNITCGRAAIIKAYYLRNLSNFSNLYSILKEVMKVKLNDGCTYQPYVLGRLFALMEKIQLASADWKLNRSIKDSYFTSAAATPDSIFRKLFPLSNYHMRKLKRDKPGYASRLEEEKVNLICMLTENIPKRFSTDEINCFYIGYYHQTQNRYEKEEEN